jgi:predicted dehydrogenase
MKQHGIGIIGVGLIADFHARAIGDIPAAKLVAACARTTEKVERFAAEHDCAAHTDYKDLLARDDIDVVTVCTPSGAHMEPAVAAAEAGKHAIVEKPLDITLERVDAILAAHQKAGTRVCGIFPSRYSEVNQLIKRTVDAGRFGRITFGGAYIPWWRTQAYYDEGGWKGTIALDGGGACMNQSIHCIDLLQWVMGGVAEVSAFTATLAHERIEVEDTAVAALRFRSGALGLIQAATSMWPGQLRRLEVAGTAGYALTIDQDLGAWTFAEETDEDEQIRQRFRGTQDSGGGASDPAAISHKGFTKEFTDFLEALDAGGEPLIPGRAARDAVEVILALYRSARERRPVALPL